ncbi:MAG: hypothetical protein ACRC41_02460 [Sarcina sp.]
MPRTSITDFYTSNGWYHDPNNSKWYYYINGVLQKGWFHDPNGNWVYFNSSGEMITGWFNDPKGNWVYFQPDGIMASSQWIEDKGQWYYLGSDGIMEENQWVKDNGKWYYVGPNGAMEVSTDIDGWELGPDGVGHKIPLNSPYNTGEDDEITTETIQYEFFARQFGLKASGNFTYSETFPVSTVADVKITLKLGDIVAYGGTKYTYNLSNGSLTYQGNFLNLDNVKAQYNFSLPNGKSIIDLITSLPGGKLKLGYDTSNGIFLSIISDLYKQGTESDKLSVTLAIRIIPGDNPNFGQTEESEEDTEEGANDSVSTCEEIIDECEGFGEDLDSLGEYTKFIGVLAAVMSNNNILSKIQSIKGIN